MHHFYLKDGQLFVEDLRVLDIARKYGTPAYIYSARTIADHYTRLDSALGELDRMICYAVKANGNLAVLRLVASLGGGFDIVSGGELFRVVQAGGAPAKCTFAGVGKTPEEIAYALRKRIYAFVVESEAELEAIDNVARDMKRRAPVAIRVNPNVDADTHHKITTGTYENKFGIAYERVPALYAKASRMKGVWLRGTQMHIGSQIVSPAPFHAAVRKMAPLVRELSIAYGLEFFSIGGGMGVVYDSALASGSAEWWREHKRPPLTPESYAAAVVPTLKSLGVKIAIEPGRFLTANAGILVAEVLYVKKTGRKNFVVVDAAMNDLIRPAFYDAYHEIVPVQSTAGKLVKTDLVGPICESGDVFCKDRPLPPLRQGDFVALMSAGAYGFSMACNYNGRPRPPEILVHRKRAHIARKRENWKDLIQGEKLLRLPLA